MLAAMIRAHREPWPRTQDQRARTVERVGLGPFDIELDLRRMRRADDDIQRADSDIDRSTRTERARLSASRRELRGPHARTECHPQEFVLRSGAAGRIPPLY